MELAAELEPHSVGDKCSDGLRKQRVDMHGAFEVC